MEIVSRSFNFLYIYMDIAWLLFFCGLLFFMKRTPALIAGLIGGVVYFAVDYGIFYLLLKTRTVTGADTLAFLLWLSMSYGITNFAWIWLMLDRDKNSLEWSVIIVSAWLAIALLSQNFGMKFPAVSISRGTVSYHGIMAMILFCGYAIAAIRNMKAAGDGKTRAFDIPRLLLIGIGVQLAWEAVLLISGIRPANWRVITLNSLIETNLGLPYLFLIHRFFNRKEKMKKSI